MAAKSNGDAILDRLDKLEAKLDAKLKTLGRSLSSVKKAAMRSAEVSGEVLTKLDQHDHRLSQVELNQREPPVRKSVIRQKSG